MLQASSESSMDDLSEASNSELKSMGTSGSVLGLNISGAIEKKKKRIRTVKRNMSSKGRVFKVPCKTARYCSKTTLTTVTPVF